MKRTDQILEEYRKKKNITQEKLSELVGLSRPHLSHILTGNRHPKSDTLEKLLNALNISDEDRNEIYFYEAFAKTPEYFQDEFFAMSNKLARLEKEIEKYKKLEELKRILEVYFNKPY